MTILQARGVGKQTEKAFAGGNAQAISAADPDYRPNLKGANQEGARVRRRQTGGPFLGEVKMNYRNKGVFEAEKPRSAGFFYKANEKTRATEPATKKTLGIPRRGMSI